jgi:hypothetical protein
VEKPTTPPRSRDSFSFATNPFADDFAMSIRVVHPGGLSFPHRVPGWAHQFPAWSQFIDPDSSKTNTTSMGRR